jgi:hypothetical protein
VLGREEPLLEVWPAVAWLFCSFGCAGWLIAFWSSAGWLGKVKQGWHQLSGVHFTSAVLASVRHEVWSGIKFDGLQCGKAW